MAPPKGNQFWKLRSSHGRDPIFKDSDQLWKACVEYFEWVESHPLQEEKLFTYQGHVTRTTINKMRAMTLTAMCVFLDIEMKTWFNYTKRDNFLHITTRISAIISSQKFEGAAAEMFNPNIIARDLGLKDTSKLVTDDGKGGDAPINKTLSDEDQEKFLKKIREEFT